MGESRFEKHNDNVPERDELRARFTAWLDTMIFRAKLKYLRQKDRDLQTISIDEVPRTFLEWQEPGFAKVSISQEDFEFEEVRLAQAFSQLPLMRKEILRLLFVEERQPSEIAMRLNCSVQHVYNQKSLAIKKLRELLGEEGGCR